MLRPAEHEAPRSWLDDALARFEHDNGELVTRTRALLDVVVRDPPRHARMLNTLSLLEHMGSHKIMATQHSAAIDQATLRHVADEAQHAYFMKRHAEKTAERPLEYCTGDLLAPAAARMYFQRLEATALRAVGVDRARAVYLYMSLIVEFRALWFYGVYQHVLRSSGHALSLKRVLGEERAHLVDMAARLEAISDASGTHTLALQAAEKLLFGRLLRGLEQALSSTNQ